MRGRLLEIDRQLTSNKGGGGKGVHKNITEPYGGEGESGTFCHDTIKNLQPSPLPSSQALNIHRFLMEENKHAKIF